MPPYAGAGTTHLQSQGSWSQHMSNANATAVMGFLRPTLSHIQAPVQRCASAQPHLAHRLFTADKLDPPAPDRRPAT